MKEVVLDTIEKEMIERDFEEKFIEKKVNVIPAII
jgi:hypothetical protein